MKPISIIVGFLLLDAMFAFGQREGDTWVIGYANSSNPNYSVMHINFSDLDFNLEWHFDERMYMDATSTVISDGLGKAILWTNGMRVFGVGTEIVIDEIANDGDTNGYYNYWLLSNNLPFGFPRHDASLILPVPESPNSYMVIYHSAEIHPEGYWQMSRYFTANVQIVDTGYVVSYKDSLLGPHLQWYSGTLSATRHANGRDWWVTSFQADSPRYFVYLLDPSGIRLDHEGEIDVNVKAGLGQTAFSNSGTYLARMDAIDDDQGEIITLYQFDRCSGDFTRMATIHESVGTYTGAAFSPSEQYLYADDNNHIWQWDLWAEDIFSSRKLVDTFDGFIQPGWFPMRFGPMRTAPDGRIYIVPPAGSSKYIHVVNRPNLSAEECNFRQHSINLLRPNNRSVPNIPNYRLGPLDGSPCDTLGLNNLPVSRWRYEPDEVADPFTIRFTDLSYYAPEVWSWDFGDGGMSSQASPLHTFAPGFYHVCQTVSNQYATDSTCKWIEILPTDIMEERTQDLPDITISPNPFHDFISIETREGTFREVDIRIYDIHGELIFEGEDLTIPSRLYLPDFPPGLLMCVVAEEDGTSTSYKLMKL